MADPRTICDVDPNFRGGFTAEKKDIVFHDVRRAPFSVHGIFYEDGKYRRLPENVARSVSAGVHFLHANTAGGRVRFQTDSPYIAISARMENICKMDHFALTGSAGFDLYVKETDGERYAGTFRPIFTTEDGHPVLMDLQAGYASLIGFDIPEMRELTINFPVYTDVCSLEVGLSENAVLLPPRPYRIETPVVYYGSSITQGGCASRPGMAYQEIISRRLGCDYVNLGFSGCALAEPEMRDYISGLTMSLFVLDYDHNADTPEYLAATHEPLFRAVRETHPDLPVVMMSRPKYYLNEEEEERRRIVTATYEHAVSGGDRNVWLLTGPELMRDCKGEGTVDGSHPTDLGFSSMAHALGDLMEKILSY